MNRLPVLLLCLCGLIATATSQSCESTRSLTYVIDTTGSMSNEIAQVCQQTRLITEELEGSPSRNLYRHFVLVTFNDPAFGPAQIYNSSQQLTDASCALRVSGGGDCPEMALNGLLIALNETCPQSVIYLFTDASAKDTYLLQSVLEVLERKQIRVVFALSSRGCSGSYPEFETIATRSGGQIFYIDRNEVEQILAYVRLILSGQPPGTLLFRQTTSSNWSSHFQVLPGTSSLSLTISCELGLPEVTVTSPNNTDTGRTLTTGRSVLTSYHDVTAGRWYVQVHTTNADRCIVSVTASSFLSQAFSFYFGLRTGILQSSAAASVRPVAGTWNYQYVYVPSGVNLSRVDHVNIHGQQLRTFPVSEIVWHGGNVIALGPFVPMNESFFIRFIGTSDSGAAFEELSTTSVTSEVRGATPDVCDSVHTGLSQEERVSAYSDCLTIWQSVYNNWLASAGRDCASPISIGCLASSVATNISYQYASIHRCWLSTFSSWRTAYQRWTRGGGQCVL